MLLSYVKLDKHRDMVLLAVMVILPVKSFMGKCRKIKIRFRP